ncbi:MAG: glycoside hydrolase 3 protein [Bathelium mastoideum]|nr:MAG: glycoside hydrolase 3 protein [Bathelium mastoideum]KAI9686036.1 MAG: glycoside hydrolase 3 protein [Bathelium mastoideum]
MRVSAIATALAAAAPVAVLAQNPNALGAKLGFALGTKLADGSCKYTSDYEKDFDAISSQSGSKIVRGYSATDCNFAQQILPAAQNRGFQVILGIWPDEPSSFDADNAAVQQYANQYASAVYAVTVGSETLYRGNFTGPELLQKINTVKSGLPKSIKVGTADSWNKYADGTADALVTGGVDILLINAFAYWQDETVEQATGAKNVYFDDMSQAISHIQKLSGSTTSIELWNGETGWPTTGGTNYGVAQANTAWAAEYYSKSVCGMLAWGVGVFYFEAFDESWKPDSVGDNGDAEDEKHWGAMDANRNLKPGFSLKCNYLDW